MVEDWLPLELELFELDEPELEEVPVVLEDDDPEPLPPGPDELEELEEPVDEELLELDESPESESDEPPSDPTVLTTSTSSRVVMESFVETTTRRDASPCCVSIFTTVPMISPRA